MSILGHCFWMIGIQRIVMGLIMNLGILHLIGVGKGLGPDIIN